MSSYLGSVKEAAALVGFDFDLLHFELAQHWGCTGTAFLWPVDG